MIRLVHCTSIFTALAIVSLSPVPAMSHGEASHASEIGRAGDPADVSRTLKVDMTDNEFEPASISVAAGETIRFVVANEGELVHEFNIGDAEMHAAHREEMMSMLESGVLEADRINHEKMDDAGMAHDDPNSILLEPGQRKEIVWTFPQSGTLEFACNVPGHYEAGMVGDIVIGERSS